MTKNKVLIIFRNLNLGGISSLYTNLILENQKANNDFEFIIVCFFAKKEVKKEFEQLGIKIYVLPYKGKLSFFKLKNNIREIISKENVKIIHSNTPFDRMFIFLHLFKFPHITTFHTSTPFQKSNNFLLDFFFSFLDKKLIQLTKVKIIAVSQFVKKRLIENNISKNQVNVIISGIPDVQNLHFNTAELDILNNIKNEMSLICVGRFHYDKGQLDLISVFYELTKINKKVKLYFLGDGNDSYYNSVINKIEYYNIASRIVFLGYKSNVDIYMQNCKALLFPSKNEALGLTVIEAMKNETLILTSNVGGISELIKDNENGFFINFEKPQKAALSIDNILINEMKNEEIKKSARSDYDQHFQSHLFYSQYIKEYKNLIQ